MLPHNVHTVTTFTTNTFMTCTIKCLNKLFIGFNVQIVLDTLDTSYIATYSNHKERSEKLLICKIN